MVRTLVGRSLLIVALFGWNVSTGLAQENHMIRGTITSLSSDSVTLHMAAHDMAFTVDNGTIVETRGGATKTRAAKSAGRPGPALSELLRAGQSVEITYTDQSGQPRAARIRAIARLTETEGGERATGTVTSVSTTALAIRGTTGKGSFTQTFAIDPHTNVIGKGVGRMAASKGGRLMITDAVAVGDRVAVWFRKVSPDALHASEVRVTQGHGSSSTASK